MRVLVTGGHGFIGSHVVDLLHDPVIFDRQGRPGEHPVILGDIRDPVAVTEAVAHADGVIHLCGVLGTQETIADPRPAAETNVLGSINVFEAVTRYEVPCVYIAVGNHWMDNPYSITKSAAERLALCYNANRGARIAVVRALNAYGPRQSVAAPYGPSKVRKIMPSFILRALAGDPIEIYGDGQQVMDMIYVTDVARVLVAALGDHGNYSTPFEAGTGRPTTVEEIAKAVIAEVGRGDIRYLPMRPGEIPSSVVLGDPSTLAPLGITELVQLEDGVKATVESYQCVS